MPITIFTTNSNAIPDPDSVRSVQLQILFTCSLLYSSHMTALTGIYKPVNNTIASFKSSTKSGNLRQDVVFPPLGLAAATLACSRRHGPYYHPSRITLRYIPITNIRAQHVLSAIGLNISQRKVTPYNAHSLYTLSLLSLSVCLAK
jgi:hypothetical protein